MTCNNCLYTALCNAYRNLYLEDKENAEKECPSFKNNLNFVEVVRCRNCKHHHSEQEPCHGRTEHFCSKLNIQVFADFYCGYGESIDI